jgi:hypothetical protein
MKKKKMYCAFIDFEKAFDKIWREGWDYVSNHPTLRYKPSVENQVK